jgi:hypothetical protein
VAAAEAEAVAAVAAADPGRLREESRALLKLLLESGQSYEDIAGVLGTARDDVRERARGALAELGGDRPDPELTDYLLGQASPVDRADMARRLSAHPGEAERAGDLADALRDVAPQATLPSLPADAGRGPAVPPPPAAAAAGDGASAGSRVRLVLALAALAILATGVILVATGAFGGGDEQPQPDPGVSLEDADAVSVELSPSAGDGADGEAILGLATADQPFVDLTMRGLEEIEASDAYILWLMIDDERGWPLGIVEPNAEGEQNERYPVPAFLLSTNVVKDLSGIVVSRSPRQEAFEAADKAAKSGVPEVEFVGEAVASGEVPSTGSIAPRD